MSQITIRPTTVKSTCHTHLCRNKMKWMIHAKNAPPNTGLMLCDECLDSTLDAILAVRGLVAGSPTAPEGASEIDYRVMFDQIGKDFEQGLLSEEDVVAFSDLMDRIALRNPLPFEPDEDVPAGLDTVEDDVPIEEEVAGLPPVSIGTYEDAEKIQDIDKSVEIENNEDEATTSLGGEPGDATVAQPPAPKKTTRPPAKKKAPAKKSGGRK